MSSFFNKVRGSVIQIGSQLVSSVKTISTVSATVPSKEDLSPEDEMILVFGQISAIIDSLALSDGADSIEMDVKLSQTELRAKLKRLVEILQSDAESWVTAQRKGSTSNEEESLIPCIDHFLQMNIVGELCNRAMSDVPRGIMRLTLTALSTLIKNVPYPFLPHQSVHKPLAKLVFIAARYEALVGDVSQPLSPEVREKYASYQRRIDISLTSMLRNIWRKIIENPPSLDYFIVSDRRTSSVDHYTADRSPGPKMQIDILSALLPLIHNPIVGYYAQESILIALNLRDTRVDYFLLYNTNFAFSLVRNLCDDFNAAVAFLQTQLTTNPQAMMPPHLLPFCSMNAMHGASSNPLPNVVSSNSAVKSGLTPSSSVTALASATSNLFGFFPAESTKEITQRLSSDLQAARLRAHGHNNSTVNVLGSFINSLVFLRAVFAALAEREVASSNDTSDNGGTGLGSPTTLRQGAAQSRHHISATFYSEFLIGCLQPALEGTNEVQSSAVYVLVKLLVSHLSTSDLGLDPSHILITSDRPKELAAYESSGNTAFFAEEMTELSLLSDTLHFLLRDGSSSTSSGSFPSGYYTALTDRASSMSKSLSLSSNLLLYSLIKAAPPVIGLHLLQHVQEHHTKNNSKSSNNAKPTTPAVATAAVDMTGLPFDNTMSFDDALSRSCTAIKLEFKQTAPSSTPASSSSSSSGNNNNLPGFMQRYVQFSTRHLLQKIFHLGDGLIFLFLDTDDQTEKLSTGTNSLLTFILQSKQPLANSDSAVDNLLHRVLKRLQSYANLRIDEQIALSGLLTELCCLMCLSMLMLGRESSTQPAATEQLKQYHLLLKKLSMLRSEINNIVKQVQDVRKKMLMFRDYLTEEAKSYLENVDVAVDPAAHTTAPSASLNTPNAATPMHTMSASHTALNQRRKIVESETMQNKHVLTSALILQEMQQEAQAYLFALMTLRRALKDHQRQQQTHADHTREEQQRSESQRVDEEEYQEDHDDAIAAEALLHSTLAEKGNSEQYEKMFVREYKLMEGAIEALVSQGDGGAVLVA